MLLGMLHQCGPALFLLEQGHSLLDFGKTAGDILRREGTISQTPSRSEKTCNRVQYLPPPSPWRFSVKGTQYVILFVAQLFWCFENALRSPLTAAQGRGGEGGGAIVSLQIAQPPAKRILS